MKTAIAAFLFSSKKFLETNKSFNGSISFLLTADEEGDAVGKQEEEGEKVFSQKVKEQEVYINMTRTKINF